MAQLCCSTLCTATLSVSQAEATSTDQAKPVMQPNAKTNLPAGDFEYKYNNNSVLETCSHCARHSNTDAHFPEPP